MKTIILLLFYCVALISDVRTEKMDSRIVGGEIAKPHSAPYIISIRWKLNDNQSSSHICAGSLISESWILTAAHCLFIPGLMKFVAGENNLIEVEKTEQHRYMKGFHIHERYAGTVGPYDIAIIKVEYPFILNEFVRPIDLPEERTILRVGQQVTLFGWGNKSNTTKPIYPNVLQKLVKSAIDWSLCVQIYSDHDIHPSNLCTGPLDGSASACNLDSGGPLVQYDTNNNATLVGIVSWGSAPCAKPNTSNVYTRVSAFIAFINTFINSNP